MVGRQDRHDGDPRRRLLLDIGATLLGGGTPVGDVEDELRALGRPIGAPEVQVAAWSTGLFVGLSPDSSTAVQSAGAGLRFDQVSDVFDVIQRLRTGRLDVAAAQVELAEIRREPPPWPVWVAELGAVPIGVGLCLLLQPSAVNVLFAALGSLVVAGLLAITRRWPSLRSLLPVASAFLVSLVVLGAFNAGWLDGPLRTIVATLALLLPGSEIVTGLTETASRAVSAGASRLVAALVQLALFFAGVVGAAAVTGTSLSHLDNEQIAHPGWWPSVLGVALATVGLVINFYPPLEHIGSTVAVIAVAALAQVGLGAVHGAALGGLAGALAAAVTAVVISRLPHGPMWRITYLPAFLVVAPGSFGLLNASQVELGSGDTAADGVFAALAAFFSIAIGALIGAVIARASDRGVRHAPPPTSGPAHP
ncbi:threonine/serine exporter family protein [Luteipulveratus halotolerans]|uniref:Threonine/serine exporter-like N-terminal domain-containing protein n=1 Tax=Luteipulveratus halotolerans TaxID=1631356 RepID=A0A0L6CK20_9MICO|nr:threonine/serine exporter family protein [Luteipulveratus halotolerans]KNX37868.1 hypothetical protein VV01_13020 [Luteipulveratus halotolerans]